MTNQRSDRVGEAIKRLVSEMLQRRLKDVRITGMVSVTDVEVSGDLRHAKVFVSIFGEKEQQDQTMEGLQSAAGFVRSEVGKQLQLRYAPDIHFFHDKSIENGAHINALLNKIKTDREDSPVHD